MCCRSLSRFTRNALIDVAILNPDPSYIPKYRKVEHAGVKSTKKVG